MTSETVFEIVQLDEHRLRELRLMEEQMNLKLVAVQRCSRLARLSREQLAQLRSCEAKLGTVLLAYEPEPAFENES